MNDTNGLAVGDDLEITDVSRRGSVPGTWVSGRLHEHRFQALVFPRHAENDEYEIGDSRISKLWIQRLNDHATVFNWDRGQDIPAANPTAQAIVDFLCEGLADFAYPED